MIQFCFNLNCIVKTIWLKIDIKLFFYLVMSTLLVSSIKREQEKECTDIFYVPNKKKISIYFILVALISMTNPLYLSTYGVMLYLYNRERICCQFLFWYKFCFFYCTSFKPSYSKSNDFFFSHFQLILFKVKRE